MRRPLVFLLACSGVACALVVLAAVLGHDGAEPSGPPPVEADVSDPLEPAHAPLAASELPATLESHARSRPALRCNGPTLVVVTEERVPVAGAEVRWFACEQNFTRVDPALLDDLEAGERYTTDADGRVRVAQSEHGAWVHVAAGTRVGQSNLPGLAEGELLVILAEAEIFHVRVVDPAGAPVRGVRVELGANIGDALWLGDARTTAQDGRATLECHATVRERAGEMWIEPGLLIEPPLHVVAARGSSPEAPIEIALPSVGSVRVVVEGAQGVDADTNGNVWLWAEAPGGFANPDWKLLPLRDGVARAGCVAVGGLLGARVTIDSLPWPVDCRGPGPQHAGEEAELALRIAELCWIRLRMLDAGGDPIRGSSVGVNLAAGDRRRGARFPTDASGALHIPLTDPWSSGEARYAQINVAGLGQALVDLAREFPPGTTDLGDVRIGDGPRIAKGRVVDERGEPLSNARVQLVRFDNESQSERLPTAGLPRIATGLDGTFELIGLADPDVYGLRVTASGYVTARRPLVLGEQGIVIALAEYGSIRGNLVFTGELTRESVQVWLADGSGFARTIEVESKGFFRVVDVVPGKWELRVQRAQSHDVLARVGGIEVAAGGSVELDPIEVKATGVDQR